MSEGLSRLLMEQAVGNRHGLVPEPQRARLSMADIQDIVHYGVPRVVEAPWESAAGGVGWRADDARLAAIGESVERATSAQATSGAVEPPFLSHHLLLVDSKGTGLILFPGPDHTLVDPLNKRVWQVPDHLRLPLEGRGLIFP